MRSRSDFIDVDFTETTNKTLIENCHGEDKANTPTDDDGQDFYLGPHGSRPSRREYERLVGEWLQNGRSLPIDPQCITVAELINAYRKHAETYYVKNGRQTDEVKGVKAALRYLRRTYGDKRAAEFGPLSLEVVRQKMIDAGISPDGSRPA